MKKLFPVILLFALGLTLHAQKTKFGVFIDPQFGWLSSESRDLTGNGSFFGVNGGLVIDHYFQDNYAFQTGISIGTQGGSLKFENEATIHVYDDTQIVPAGTVIEYRLQYLTIPLGLKLKTNQIGYFSYFAKLGFTNQINVKGKAQSSFDDLNDVIITKEINLFNLSYHFGIGAEYALGEDTALTFGGTFHNGFLDITKSSSRVVSRVFAINAGVLF